MSSTFSPSLRIELVGDGDQSGIWGQTTNTNLGTLIEQAITGVATIDMADTNYVMSNYNGVSDESRNQVLVLIGTNTAARNLIAPLVEKTYIVKNSTTGGFTVQIIGASGTGVTIPNGATVSVYCDGTNFYAASNGAVGNFSVAGNLAVVGTTTLTGALTASTATFSGAISSVSPTFTGAPLSTTASPGTNTTQIATTAFVGAAITAQGLGTIATQNANNVSITGGTITGITDLAVADGGTGASSITANSVVLGNGTSALSGNLVAPGTSGNVLTSNGTTWTSASAQTVRGLGLGGETWHSTSFSIGTTYTNSYSYPIMVSTSILGSSSGGYQTYVYVGGVQITYAGYGGATGTWTWPVSFIVPPGVSYYFSGRGVDGGAILY